MNIQDPISRMYLFEQGSSMDVICNAKKSSLFMVGKFFDNDIEIGYYGCTAGYIREVQHDN